ncbi:hypothetical protein SERLA73DRAFT_174315 [Serpula lacrymans var. lacrymans S7.3]|uniref:MARVEL domain-containing protein n=2 Tax=Serpula lacrymans var. lacrymans TaxID=341189 RepID=F8PF61_SERL3|nr:uncharacterized protein SERLADRAFT_455784 [Serpula lacrymans var. lacrymans S7.9]EGO05253.1 hypothetical protein SERLA73DRAFT_174315 [Serpula lacrymans var. lacrymans S7.3]EGO31107.1 hypothetical protein SERLADRAFT_455784 [Serpula lacrymans var. lacrymans S7.9]
MSFSPLFRTIVFAISLVFSLIVLGIAAHITSVTLEYFGGYLIFGALAIATAVLTIVTIPVLFIMDVLRRGAFTSMIVVELVWLFVLWVLWLATGADAASATSLTFPFGCNYFNPLENQICHEFAAVEAFAFLNFILMFVYTVVILVFSIVAGSRGNSVWTSSVKEANFHAPTNGATTTHPLTQYSGANATHSQPEAPSNTVGTPVTV